MVCNTAMVNMSFCQTQNVEVRFHVTTNLTLPTSPSITVAVNNSENEIPSLEPLFGLSVLIY